MTAPGMGSPLVVSTRPSTYMYSPFPSDAIDSPIETVADEEWSERRHRLGTRVEYGRNGTKRTIGCILSEIWAQEAALRRVPDSGIVERLDEGRHTQHIRE